jgi:hypothetical protein
MVARSSELLRKIVGTGTPFASTWLVERKFAPFTYISCCTEPSCAVVGAIEPSVGSLAAPTVTLTVADADVSAAEVAVIVIAPGESEGAKKVPAGMLLHKFWGSLLLGQIIPIVGLPPTTVIPDAVTLQVTAVFAEPVTVDVNRKCSPGAMEAELGVIVTRTPVPTVT